MKYKNSCVQNLRIKAPVPSSYVISNPEIYKDRFEVYVWARDPKVNKIFKYHLTLSS
jgi:hypothetical protein